MTFSSLCDFIQDEGLVLVILFGWVDQLLTAFVLTVMWGTVKKYGALRGHVAYRLKEQKRSRCFERTLLIKNFKYGSSLSIFVQKNKEAQRSQVSHF